MLEEADVEGHVVPDDAGIAGEGLEGRERGRRVRRAAKVLIADAGEPRDGALEVTPGIDERGESLAGAEPAVGGAVEADGADLDDAVARRIEAGGLEVDRDELLQVARFLAGRRRESGAAPGGCS